MIWLSGYPVNTPAVWASGGRMAPESLEVYQHDVDFH